MKNLEKMTETKTFTVSVLLMIMLFGFFLRFNELGYWLDNVEQYFFNSGSLPVTIGVDPYYYMDIADDLLQGKIDRFDPQRHYPEGTNKPSAAPLLSVLLALFSFVTRQPMEWIAILMPPFLGVLLAIPTYLLGYLLTISAKIPWQKDYVPSITTAKSAGFCAALFALLSPAYIQRSSIGWCDTDILNVTFVTLFIFLAMRIATPKKTTPPWQLLLTFAISLLIFIWWWDQMLAPPLLLAGGPLLLAFLFIPPKLKRQPLRHIAAFTFFLLLLWLWQGSTFLQLPQSLSGTLDYIFGNGQATILPGLEQLVQEQKDSSFQALALKIAGSTFVYLISMAGIFILAFLARRNFLFLAPLMALSALAFEASRFTIFAAPLFGLGLATIVFLGLAIPNRHNLLKIMGCVVFIVSCSFFPVRKAEQFNPPIPTLDPLISEAMGNIATTTPQDAVIWTSWGHGHPLVYYSQRKTLADGMYHPTWLQYILKFPLAANDFRLAANWIQFHTVNGRQGLQRIFTVLTGDKDNWELGIAGLTELLGGGVARSRTILRAKYNISAAEVEKLLYFLFPPNCPPLYLFMDYKLVGESWYYMGKWDLKNKIGPASYTKISIFSYLRNNSAITGLSDDGDYAVNLKNGLAQVFNTGYFDLTRLNYDFRGNTYAKNYPPSRNTGHTLHLKQNDRHRVQFGVLVDNQTANTVFLKLFFEKQFSQDFFSPVLDESPVYLLCEVHGEKYQGTPANLDPSESGTNLKWPLR